MTQRILTLGGAMLICFCPMVAAEGDPCEGAKTATISIEYADEGVGGGSVSPSPLMVDQDDEVCWQLAAPLRPGEKLRIESDNSKETSQGQRVADPYKAKGSSGKKKLLAEESGAKHLRTEKADAHGTWVYKVVVKKGLKKVAVIDPEVIIKKKP